MAKFLTFEQKKVLVNQSNFGYCPLAWCIASTKFLNKKKNLQKLLQNDYHSSYETFLQTSGKQLCMS